MAQQYNDMYSEYNPSNRSPGSQRGYAQNGLTLNRQPSRHFDTYGGSQLSGLYTAEDHAASQYDPTPQRFDRMPSATLHSNYQYGNDGWNYGGANSNSHMMGGTGRVKPSSRRAGLPPNWMGPPMPQPPNMNSYPLSGPYNPQGLQQPNERMSSPNPDDELIPTAIVIKNIPFAVKKEQLVALMTDMRLPLPYAFNYHFDNGIFRGLAFANFTTPDETEQVINVMNHLELQGRKLRVEYKKMLPAQERERIERDKREKRGQLQEQHQPLAPNQVSNPLHPQASMNSLSSNHHPTSPSPNSVRGKLDIDLNDPTTLGYYNELLVFKSSDRETLIFPSTVIPADRRIIHTLAHHMGLEHRSEGQGDTRCVQILKHRANAISPPSSHQYSSYNETQRRGLARAATIDFSETRDNPGYHNHTLGRQGSGLLDIPGSPGMGGLSTNHNLRAAKSFADLRSYTPSPAHSTASFPVGLTSNIQRYTDNYGPGSAASGTPNHTPTSANRDDAFALSNGMSNMNLYSSRSNVTGRIGQERETTSNAGPIGSQRPINGNTFNEDNARTGTSVERQPRGPGNDWGVGGGFSRTRQNGHVNRGSGELDLNSFENGWDDNRAQDSSDRNGASASMNQRY
ncbi:hypothetical protein BDZ45DRAFT_740287 [Acephala macrosclerotiorum]|nr:hypothetical protein BDZ45DRAFT_740287 [Acephala macrosclerotiorum]